MTRNEKIGIICLVLAFVVVSVMLWIFGNSQKNGEESDKDSSRIIERVKPVIDPKNKISHDKFNFGVRKTAHFTEYAVLGMCCTALTVAIQLKKKRRYYILPFMMTLFTAVFDELIQSQTGRTSSIVDVMIDFGGSSFGILLFSAAILILHYINRRHCKSQKDI